MTYSYNLPCYDSRKSFYGKAQVIVDGDNFTLSSYSTNVLRWDEARQELTPLWSGYSVTTMRHINSFLIHLGIRAPGGKAWWDSLTTNTPVRVA